MASEPKYVVSNNQKHLIHKPTGLMVGIESTSPEHLRKAMKTLRPLATKLEAGQKVYPDGDKDDDYTFFRQVRAGAKVLRRERREDFASSAAERGWTRHNDTHYSRMVKGEKLDYWPGPMKWCIGKRTMAGNVYNWLRKNDAEYNTYMKAE